MFSVINREEDTKDIAAEEIDLLVIGGGITGAGIALDAQTRGIKTVLIEMQDFGAGTSSRSTKLVHGGLRYLKQLEFGLVAEVGKERAIVYENGPHITKPEWMLLPIVKGGTYGKLASSVGIRLYDFLAGVKKSERRQMLNKAETLRKEPLLREKGLKGSGYYVEYRTDDARLTLEVLKKAVQFGARAFNYMRAEDLIYRDGKLAGVRVADLLSHKKFELYAKKIVNATGPWVDELREKDGSKRGKYLHWTKGVHLVVDQNRFPLRQAVYFDTPDGRMVFAIPREGKTYIGTTDTDYHEDLVHPRVTKEDRDYILTAANHMFPTIQLTAEDVESSWAGIRPLIHEEGKSPSEISRKDEIFHSPTGLITIAGGKLTGYRKMAERVVDLVTSELAAEQGTKYKPCHTERIVLSGGDLGGPGQLPAFIEKKVAEGMQLGLTKKEASRLANRYGSNVDLVYEVISKGRKEAEQYGMGLEVYGSLVYGIENEMVATPADFFIRRTGSLLFDIAWVREWKETVVQFMKDKLGWDDHSAEQQAKQLEMEIKYATEAI
ncbi:glycerol-3-phosphate dehydrogenase/oxidase [Paenactinomyces guangxiensis]|uniref:Glycerol-3-phosphate dehydrogenase n=1 Tax=Paenactinomyces guangxiensis TaxID=1490290 RepID=A0A7W1WV62_9BACL|nr:glycerol-3-phosphate dehydrogenase/oxidase [Paenactinomyces guangxiensis]MBA4496542.1 glycerol-3-phosphate dehydrogenase/oxidase [Paenactinomyces guangxiensis]MBH8593672.1 glycerol-3-phosphate dehydrogenase/oxidase [Paenactinomyces guangxiensis]